MINTLTLAGLGLLIGALVMVLLGFFGMLGATVKRARFLRRPLPGDGGVWAGAITAKEAYVPGTIARRFVLLLGGLIVAAVALPLLWAGRELADFTPVKGAVELGRVRSSDPSRASIEGPGQPAVEGTLGGRVWVAHAEYLQFLGWPSKLGLGSYARLVSVTSYADSGAVLSRKGLARVELQPPSPLYAVAARIGRRLPEWVAVQRRFTGSLAAGSSARVQISPDEFKWIRDDAEARP